MKKILILGGGFAGVETYQRLHALVHPALEHDVQIQLINRTNYFTFSPMLHEAATGAVAREHVVQPLREIMHCCGNDFHQAEITGIDIHSRVVETTEGPHSYDILVVALGVEQGYFGTPGAAEHALTLKWLDGALNIRNRIINSFEKASEAHDKHDLQSIKKFLRFVVVGGGATGTELAGQISDLVKHEMREFYGDVPHSMCDIQLLHAGERILEILSPKASAKAQKRLESLGVQVRLNARVTEVMQDGVKLATGETIPSNSVFWTAGTEATLPKLLPASVLTERGLAKVKPTFQLEGFPNVFVMGDCASVTDTRYAYPPTAQAAVQAARVVAKNIVSQIKGKKLIKKHYVHKGDIIPIGNWWGVLELKPFLSSGILAWLVRRAVFLKTMYGWTNRIEVAFAWFIALFLPRDTSEF